MRDFLFGFLIGGILLALILSCGPSSNGPQPVPTATPLASEAPTPELTFTETEVPPITPTATHKPTKTPKHSEHLNEDKE